MFDQSVCLEDLFFCLEVCMCYIYGIANCKFDDWDNHLHYPFLGFLLHGRFFFGRIKNQKVHIFTDLATQ